MYAECLYNEVVKIVCGIVGVSCSKWNKCKCENCVSLRKILVISLYKVGINRLQIVKLVGISKTSVNTYLSVKTVLKPIENAILSEIDRQLTEIGILKK